jgi:hypothetical protein
MAPHANSHPLSAYWVNNPVLRLLLGRSRRPTLRYLIVLLPWPFLAYVVTASEHALVVDGPTVGLLEDTVMLAVVFTAATLPFLWFRLLRALERFFDRLPALVDAGIATTPVSLPATTDSAHRIMDTSEIVQFWRNTIAVQTDASRRWYGLTLGVFVLLVAIFDVWMPLAGIGGAHAWPLEPRQFPRSFAFGIAWAIYFFVFVVGNTAWLVGAGAAAVYKIVDHYAAERCLRIEPLAPDGQGGLASIGDAALWISLVPSAGIIILTVWSLQYSAVVATLVGGLVYGLALIMLFFLPLQSAHWAMKTVRDRELQRLSSLYSFYYAEVPQSARTDTPGRMSEFTIEKTAERLRLCNELYERAARMPVWPFDPKTLLRFLGVVVVPAVVGFLNESSGGVISRILAAFAHGLAK